jgi:hypothetical protein
MPNGLRSRQVGGGVDKVLEHEKFEAWKKAWKRAVPRFSQQAVLRCGLI